MNHAFRSVLSPFLLRLVVLIFIGSGLISLQAADQVSVEQRLTHLEQLAASKPPPTINSVDNAWLLANSAPVLLMTAPGLILF